MILDIFYYDRTQKSMYSENFKKIIKNVLPFGGQPGGGACGFFVGTLALREKGAAVLSSKAVKKLFH